MARRKKKSGPAKYRLAIEASRELILNGRLISIDPSVGSSASLPGYAVFEGGKLVENGVITVNPTDTVTKRLYEINRCLREDFAMPDVLAIEMPPLINLRQAGHSMNAIARAGLQRGIGAALAAWPLEHVVEIPPSSWFRYRPADWQKGDASDALAIGIAVLALASEPLHIPKPRTKGK